ncbi:hypothetical protein O5479_25535 [Escherichia coli]|nr:hypothetical protein [Escherichia coli]
MNRRRITRRHRRTRLSSPPTLKELIQSEIGDFFAGFGSPGEPETPEAMQRELMMRIDNVFDFFLNNKKRATDMNEKTWFRAYMWALVCVLVSIILYAGLLPE